MDKTPAIPSLSRKGTWRTYTTAEGLAGLQTEHIAEDAEGFLWIGTFDNGACRFDGDEFRTFTVKDGLEEFQQSGRRGEGEKQGSGLGLAIAKRSVELLGGSISVESQLRRGTKFTVRLKEVLP